MTTDTSTAGGVLTPAERFKTATVIRYDHGGGRVYCEDAKGSRELIADLFREDMREFVISACNEHASLRAQLVAAREALNGFVINERHMDDQELRPVRDKLFALARAVLAAELTK